MAAAVQGHRRKPQPGRVPTEPTGPASGRSPRGAQPSPETPELAVGALLQPDGLRLTAEPVTRLRDGRVLAFEVRWRVPRLDVFPSMASIWEAASSAGLSDLLDDTLLRTELEVAGQLSPAPVLLDMHPWRRGRRGLIPSLLRETKAAGIGPAQVVWQLADQADEHERLEAAPIFGLATQLRDHGFRVALAQMGAVRTPLAVVGKIDPDLIQLDRVLVDGIEADRGKRAVVSAMVGLAAHMEARLIASGVTTETEQSVLMDLGIEFGHGPLLGEPIEVRGEEASPLEAPAANSLLSLDDPLTDGEVKPAPASRRARKVGVAAERGQEEMVDILSQLARSFQGESDPDALLDLSARYLARLVPYDGICIFRADWDAGRLRPLLARSPVEKTYGKAVMDHSFSLGTGLNGWAFDLGIPQRVNDADAHPAALHIPGSSNGDESMLLVPLVSGDYRLGMLTLVRFRKDAFPAQDLTLAGLVGHMTAAAWRNLQLLDEQVQFAITDSLTSLLNARWLRGAGGRELAMAARSETPLAVLMLDLDNFKHINDSCGHAAGDAVLRSVGRTLQRSVRADDATVRYGGEEFVLILRGCDAGSARKVANQLRRGLARISMPAQSTVPRVTGSVGIALFPEHGRTLGELLAVADAAMYTAKRRGRDRVVLGHALAAEPAVSELASSAS